MASVIMDIIARDKFTEQFLKAGHEADKLGKKVEKTGSKIGNSLKVGAAVGAAAVVGLAGASIELASKFEDSQKRLEAALTGSGTSFEKLKGPIGVADKSMEKLGFTNIDTADAIANLTVATKNPVKSLKELGLTADLARFKHISLAEAATAVGKGMAGNLRPLKALGIEFPKLAAGADKGQAVLRLLNQRLGGQATAAAGTFAGKVGVLKAQFTDIGIKVGTKLIPPLVMFLGWIQKGVTWLQKHAAVAKILAVVIGGALVLAIGHVIGAWLAMNLAFLASPWGLVILGIAAVVAAVILLMKNWGKVTKFIKTVADDVWRFLKRWGLLIILVLAPVLGVPLLIWKYWRQIVGFLQRVWNDVFRFLRRWGPTILAVLVPVLGVPLLIWQKWSKITGFIASAWNSAIGWLKGLGPKVKNAVAGAANWLVGIGASIIRGLWKGIQSLGGWIWNQIKKIIPGWIKSALGIKSPPTWAVQIGVFIAKGLANGIKRFPHFIGNLAGLARGKLAALAKSVGGGFTSPGAYGSANVVAEQAYALQRFPQLGWPVNTGPGTMFNALQQLWMGESHWNPAARNTSSGAFGIPQALPASKLDAYGNRNRADVQIRWGEDYIKAVYGNPINALTAWLGRSPHWYGAGLPPTLFTRPTLIGVGERGPETVTVTPGRGSRPAMVVHIGTVIGGPGAGRLLLAEISKAIGKDAGAVLRAG